MRQYNTHCDCCKEQLEPEFMGFGHSERACIRHLLSLIETLQEQVEDLSNRVLKDEM